MAMGRTIHFYCEKKKTTRMKTSHEVNIPTSILLAIISFFLVKTYNRVEEISSRQYDFEKRITRMETKLFGENMPKEKQICFPKVYAVLSFGKKKRDSDVESQS
jgi:hypothetical protein